MMSALYRLTRLLIGDADGDADKLAGLLRDYVEGANRLAGTASTYSDLLTHALGRVDWHEIAQNLLED